MDSIKMTTETQLPQGWEIKRLGDVATSEKGKKPKNQSNEKTDEFCYPYVDIEAFEKGIIKSYTDGVKCVLCDENDFLMVWDGSRSGLVGKGIKGALGSTLVRISLPNVKNLYAYYFLLSKYKEINTRAKGSGTPHVDPDLLWNYAFPIPPLETQQAIVNKIESLFAEIDAGIASLKTAQQQLKHYRQSLLKNAFNGELTKQWRLENADRLPSAIELLAQIQTAREQYHAQQLADWQTAVQQWEQAGKQGKKPSKPTLKKITVGISDNELVIPEKQWFIGLFGDLVEIKSNLVQPERYLDFPHIAPDNIEKETGKLLSFKTIKDDGVISPKHYFYAGQIIYSKIRPNLSKLVLVDFDGLCSADMYPLESDVFNHHFLKYMMLSRYFVKKASTAGSRSVLPKINQSELSMIPLPICSLAEQTQIVAILESKLTACDQLASELATQLKQAELLKQAVLKSAFSGNLLDK